MQHRTSLLPFGAFVVLLAACGGSPNTSTGSTQSQALEAKPKAPSAPSKGNQGFAGDDGQDSTTSSSSSSSDDGHSGGDDDANASSDPSDDSASTSSAATCEATAVIDESNGDTYCSITRYCGIFGGTATLTSGPEDNPPCACECR